MERTILERKPYGPYDKHLEVVLAKTDRGEFVTWVYNKESKGYAHGHYFTSLVDAAKDYESRGAQP